MEQQAWTTEILKNIVLEALARAKKRLRRVGEAGKREVYDEHVVDITTQGDRQISEDLVAFFRKTKIPAILLSEEKGRIEISSQPRYTIAWDDIDGTENWKRGNGVMPYATILVIYEGIEPLFQDAVVAALYEHTTGQTWLAVRGHGCFFKNEKDKEFVLCKTSQMEKIELYQTGMRVDLYAMREAMDVVEKLNRVAWLKDVGSSGYHFAAVANGSTDVFVNSGCKGHEFGTGYLLVTEAGGFVSDWKGELYATKPFDFNAKYDLVCAATEKLGREVLKIIMQ